MSGRERKKGGKEKITERKGSLRKRTTYIKTKERRQRERKK